MSTDKLLNEFEAAEYLRLSVATLRTWRSTRSQNLRFIKLGSSVRYRISDLETFVDSSTREG